MIGDSRNTDAAEQIAKDTELVISGVTSMPIDVAVGAIGAVVVKLARLVAKIELERMTR